MRDICQPIALQISSAPLSPPSPFLIIPPAFWSHNYGVCVWYLTVSPASGTQEREGRRAFLEGMWALLWGDNESWVEGGVSRASRLGLTLVFPFLSLQPGHGTASWALQTLGSTTWRSQMPSCPMTLPMSVRPQRLPCALGGPNSPCSVMTPKLSFSFSSSLFNVPNFR